MFYRYKGKGQYIYNEDDKLNSLQDYQECEKIVFPCSVDTEFFSDKRIGITTQFRSIDEKQGRIYIHQDFKEYCNENNLIPRHNTIDEDLAVITYLKDLGIPLKFVQTGYIDDEVNHILYFDFFAHFAIAELLLLVHNQLKIELKDIIRKSGKKEKERGLYTEKGLFSHINQNRRLSFSSTTKSGQFIDDSIPIPYQIKLYGQWYKIRIRYFDTYGLHGVSSYKNLAESVGIKLEFKDNLTQEEKENMNLTYFANPDKFDEYSLGDLEIYNILINNSKLFEEIYKSLGIEKYYQHPKLTMGSTVEKLFINKLLANFNLENTKENIKLVNQLCNFGSSSILKQNIKDTSCLLSKVFGGRCRNNRPLDHYIENLLCDNDIDGCYGNGLRLQKYPIGKPIIESYPIDTNNEYKTLRAWLNERKYGQEDNELVYGLWHAVIDSIGELKYEQEFLSSWFNFKEKDIKNILPSPDDENTEINPKSGISKILRKEIKNAVITDDFLDYLFYICNKNQRTELLDKLVVKSAIYYPTYAEVKTLDELLENIADDDVKQDIKGNKKTTITEINTAWIGLNLGEFLVDDLIAFRKLYDKKTPLNTLYKLVINSLYGIFCSPFFASSNCVVGNNITARARLMCYLMEKGHYMTQSITDGGVFELNRVVYPHKIKYLSANNTINLYQYSDKEKRDFKYVELKPLDNAEFIYFDGRSAIIYYSENNYLFFETKKQFMKWVNKKSMEHLQNIFNPNIRVLNQETTSLEINKDTKEKIYKTKKGMYSLEVKDFYKKGYFHGSANYLLIDYSNSEKLAFRSYQNREHQSIILNNNELEKTDFYKDISPSKYFINQLDKQFIARSKVFLKKGILKVNDYSNSYEKYDNLGLCVGDTVYKSGLLREFSQSQLTFLTIEQFDKINKEIDRNKRRYNQSYEGYFINNDGLLDYYSMYLVLDNAINEEILSINKYIDINDHRLRDKPIKHPEYECLELVKEDLKTVKIEEKVKFNIVYDDEIDADIEEIESVMFDGDLF